MSFRRDPAEEPCIPIFESIMNINGSNVMWHLLFILTGLVFLSCTSSTEPQTKESVAKPMLFDSIAQDYYDDYVALYPISAMMNGDNRYNDTFPNELTVDFRQQVTAMNDFYLGQLNLINRDSLSPDAQINYDVLLYQCQSSIEEQKFNQHLLPINQMFSPPILMGMLASGQSAQPFETVKDYENWLNRLRGFTQWVDTAIVNMKTGIQKGYVLPEALTKKVVPLLEPFTRAPVEEHLFYTPVKNFPADFSEGDKKRLADQFKTIIADTLIPMYTKLTSFMDTEYLAASRKTSGINSFPDGKLWYDQLIHQYTTVDKTADEIFALGENEVARITAEMETIKQEVGFKGTLKEFFTHLRNKKELMPFRKPEEVIANFNAIYDRMKPQLKILFNTEPVTPFEVRRTEAFREASASAEYYAGLPDGSRPGIFYVPIRDIRQYNTLQDETLFLHEAIPGHHYQVSLQRENENLPKFRKLISFTVYAEGWGLYAESLGNELGLYTDPYQRFGNLSGEIHRAIRLVVDAGIHSRGWTREQAIQYSLEHEAVPEASVIAEIERYMAFPGQALSYKVGQLKIIELRAKAEADLGDKFNIAEFHQRVLESGSLPLNILEMKITAWINAKKIT
jgi:uncharacterized protein (DUF885 family)